MKNLYRILLLFVVVSVSFNSYSQIGNKNGKYDDVIQKAYQLIDDLRNQNTSRVLSSFHYTGFQEKSDFKRFIKKHNLLWLEETISRNGLPEKKDISISDWRTKVSKTDKAVHSINLTFYLKDSNKAISLTDDHISINFQKISSDTIYFDGLMFFKKSDFEVVKQMLDQAQ